MAVDELLTSPFKEQLDALYHNTDLLVAGTMGRRIIMRSYGVDVPLDVRRPNGEFRDIDAISLTKDRTVPLVAASPLEVDTDESKWVRQEANGTWLVFPNDESVAEEVEPELFAPVERTLGELVCRTCPTLTQQRLNGLVFTRPKDKVPYQEFDQFVTSLMDRKTFANDDKPLPADAYQPFAAFRKEVIEKHRGFILALKVGVRVNNLPPSVRKYARQLAKPVRQYYLGR